LKAINLVFKPVYHVYANFERNLGFNKKNEHNKPAKEALLVRYTPASAGDFYFCSLIFNLPKNLTLDQLYHIEKEKSRKNLKKSVNINLR